MNTHTITHRQLIDELEGLIVRRERARKKHFDLDGSYTKENWERRDRALAELEKLEAEVEAKKNELLA